MNAERFNRLEELYHAARQCDPRARALLLDESCGSDADLRREVELLLNQNDSAGPMHRPPLEIVAELLGDAAGSPMPAGTQLGPYRIESLLGAGGMGHVYRARDTRLGRAVAIKIAWFRFTERFEREARVISALNHPNICTVYDVGLNYLVMEVVEGQTLAVLLRQGPLPIELVLHYGAQIADALAEAHSKGIVHRDLKPGNIMVTASGAVEIIDFGLATLDRNGKENGDAAQMDGPETGRGDVLGTTLYMSPEQAEGKPVDARSDVFSTGSVLYEMLTGARAFAGDSTAGVLTRILCATPEKIRNLRPEAPEAVKRIIEKCLEKDPVRRYPSGLELARDLIECSRPARELGVTPKARTGITVFLIVLLALAGWGYERERRSRWAREEALPKIRAMVARDDVFGAVDLTRKALSYAPNDPQLKQQWLEVTMPVTFNTTPPGATVSYRSYGAADLPWRQLGITPLTNVPVPGAYLRIRLQKAGWATQEFTTLSLHLHDQNVPLLRVGQVPEGMVLVPEKAGWILRANPDPILPDYLLDKFEVSNQQFQKFVEAGGYHQPKYWRELSQERPGVPLEQAISSFRDTTGRIGPASWELGTFSKGQEYFPVGGVSWYEAAAFCEFAGKALPTIHHWKRATALSIDSEILLFSNFSNHGPNPVGANPGVTSFGVFDMAGNVKEWCRNSAGQLRAILGGAWNEPSYKFTDADAQDPFTRKRTYGIRCASYPNGIPAAALAPVEKQLRDYSKEQPVNKKTFEIFRQMYAYDKTPVDARVESADDGNPDWRRERVSYAAAYGGERIPAALYLPKNTKPPYQTVLWLPGGYAWELNNSTTGGMPQYFSFLMSTGRAVLYPVYKGTYERRVEISGPNAHRDWVIQMIKDVSRSMDYLETRSDIQTSRVGYYGMSMGGYYGTLILALEPRLKTGILLSGGLSPTAVQRPEIDPFNFARHVHVPVLMLNGRQDFLLPSENAQKPLYRWLGVSERDKRLLQLETGHVPGMQDLIREVLNWFDERLGPVVVKQ